jgi:hypothetical protein
MKVHLTGSLVESLGRLLTKGERPALKPEVMNLSGVWQLCIERSDFGGARAPQRIDVTIEHQEPYLRYSGTFVDPEGKRLPFEYEATLDGGSRFSNGVTISSRRIDACTTTSEWRSQDGQRIETTVMKVSPDGRMLAVKRYIASPEGTLDCLELYERHVALSPELIPAETPSWSLWEAEVVGTGALARVTEAAVESRLPPDRLTS